MERSSTSFSKQCKGRSYEQWKEILATPSRGGRKYAVKRNSVWDNFDITKITNAGFKLEYVAPEIHGETPVIDIELDDISSEIKFWKNSVICYVLGAHPPFAVINGYIQRLWAKYGINKIAMLKNGIILVRFDSAVGMNDVIQRYIPL